MKGRVRPTTGKIYRHIPTLTATWASSIPAKPMEMRADWRLRARFATQMHRRMMRDRISSRSTQPTRPNSSPQTAKISSVSRAGREVLYWLCVWGPFRYPMPVRPPLPMAIMLRVCCQPVSWVC